MLAGMQIQHELRQRAVQACQLAAQHGKARTTELGGGFAVQPAVTLAEGDSAAQGLGQAPLELPEAEGSATHRGYALQWWVFAAGAIAFGIYAARGFAKDEAKKQARVARENETDPSDDPSGDTPSTPAAQVSSAG